MIPDRILPVTGLMDVSDGMVRRGDEIHDPDNWVCCPECGLDNPTDYSHCFDCGEPLVE